MASLYPPGSVVSVRALLLGERIDLRGLEAAQRLATNPLLIPPGRASTPPSSATGRSSSSG